MVPENKYNQLISTGIIDDISSDYPACTAFEKIIISLRKKDWSYGDIQKELGMPPKKQIRKILLDWAPELINNDRQKVIQLSSPYSEIYNILSHTDKKIWKIFDEDVECCIKDKKIYYNGDPLDFYTEVEHFQILNEIKSQI